MGLDAYSPSAPAHVKVLVLPVGKVKQSRFAKFIRRLQRENVVRLGDVSPGGRPNRTMFSPLAFPDGLVYYDISPFLPPSSHLDLVPFEIYRQPLLVVGVADWSESLQYPVQDTGEGSSSPRLETLAQSLVTVQQGHPSALAHHVLAFDCEEQVPGLPKGIALVPPRAKSRTTTVKTVMCDMTAALLAEMSSYGKSLQELPTIETPRIALSNRSNDIGSSLPPHMAYSNRPMSMALGSRISSPNLDDKLSHRLSMPVHSNSNPELRGPIPVGRADFPSHVHRSSHQSEESLPGSSTSPPRKPSLDRTTKGQERTSITGFGPGSSDERERNRGKARVGVLIGSMYLLAGRWPDAIRELSKSASTARASSDYVWQAKALDLLVVCLLMCAWAGMDFKIPDVLQSASELLQPSSTKVPKHPPSNSQHDIGLSKAMDAENLAATRKAFAGLLPDVIHNICNLYERAYTFTDDKIPLLSYSFATIRFAKLLTALHHSQGDLSQDVLHYSVASATLPPALEAKVEDDSPSKKPAMVRFLLRAYPGTPVDTSLATSDRLSIYSAIAGVLTELGQHRKVAVILRQIISCILPSLVQARKDDAAEMGIHPAASLAALNSSLKKPATDASAGPTNDTEEGMRAFLRFACQVLGISTPKEAHEEGTLPTEGSANRPETAMRQAVLNAYGAQKLKVDLLWACVNICEALPDLAGALYYSALLLRTASSSIAPGPESSDGAASLSMEEQQRLADNINRTLGAAEYLGLKDMGAVYWDDFLVRNVELVGGTQDRSLTVQARSELENADNFEQKKEKGPFLYNPFLESQSAAKDPVLVAGEEAVFRVTLQNLFDFELVVDSVILMSNDVQIDCPPQSVVVGPYRTQTVLVYATPHTDGKVIITGCKCRVRGCRELSFSIFKDPWALCPGVKGNNLRIMRSNNTAAESISKERPRPKSGLPYPGPKSTALSLKVIPSQPSLILSGISITQSAIMLLEGETRKFVLSISNTASKTPADFVLVSFTDSTSANVRDAFARNDVSASQLYELELGLAHHPPLRLHRSEEARNFKIEPSADMNLDIEVFGKPGLADAIIRLDYGFLGFAKSQAKDQFFTRQLAIPITITVNRSLELTDTAIFRMGDDVGLSTIDSDLKVPESNRLSMTQDMLNSIGIQGSSHSHCILLLDFRNAWGTTLTLHLHTTPRTTGPDSEPHDKYHHTIQPGSITRIPYPMPRIYLPTSKIHAPIPSLNPATKRQFVVSSSTISPAAERRIREAFWYREAILSQISATWVEVTTGRTGIVDLRRNFHLDSNMVAAYKLDDVAITSSIALAVQDRAEGAGRKAKEAKQVSKSTYEVRISTFLTLRTTLRNRSPNNIRGILRVQPALANQASDTALNLHRKLLVHGSTQRVVPELAAGGEIVVETGFVVLATGTYEWSASFEDLVEESRQASTEGKRKGRTRAATGDLGMPIEDVGRRTWVSEKKCVVVAREGEDEEDGANGA